MKNGAAGGVHSSSTTPAVLVARTRATANFQLFPDADASPYVVLTPEPSRVVYMSGGRPSPYFFEVNPQSPTDFRVAMSPGNAMSQEGYRANGWPGVKQLFDNWLQILQREVGQPNLWAGILDADLPSSPSSNAPLTADEVEYVRGQIDSARKYLHGQT